MSSTTPTAPNQAPRHGLDPATNLPNAVNAQVTHLVATVTKKHLGTYAAQLKSMLTFHGADVLQMLIHAVMARINFDAGGSSHRDALRLALVERLSRAFTQRELLGSMVCAAFQGKQTLPNNFIEVLLRGLKLTWAWELRLGLSLAACPSDALQAQGLKLVKAKIATIGQQNRSSFSLGVAHELLYHVKSGTITLNATEEAGLEKALRKVHPHHEDHVLLSPLEDDSDLQLSNAKLIGIPALSSSLTAVLSSMTVPAELMEDIGYSCCASSANLKMLFAQFPQLSEGDVAHVLGMMSRTHTGLDEDFSMVASLGSDAKAAWHTGKAVKTWDIACFVDTLRSMYPKLVWARVIKLLDHPEFQLYDSKGFALIVTAYRTATRHAFPVSHLFGLWHNTSAQLSLLKLAVASPPALFTFDAPPSASFMEGVPNSIKAAIGTPRQHWFCLPLVKTLLGLSEVENYSLVRMLFDFPINNCPEILFFALSQVKKPNALHGELCDGLVDLFLQEEHAGCNFILNRVWFRGPSLDKHNRPIIIRGMARAYQRDPTCLPRILELAQVHLKALVTVLDTRPFAFAIHLAALAFQGEYLNLAQWIQTKVQSQGNAFGQACILFLRDCLLQQHQQQRAAAAAAAAGQPAPQPTLRVAPEAVDELFACMAANAGLLHVTLQEQLKQLRAHRASRNKSDREVFPPFIEKTANTYFQRIYTGQLVIEDAISLLKSFKASAQKDEQDIFACMIHSLFDEYRFFPKYPDKELRITGILFGQLIQHQLVTYIPLGIALRYVLEALRKPAASKMFRFGVLALEQFQERLYEWPQYCAFILQIGHVRQGQPQLVRFVEAAQAKASALAVPPGTASPSAAAGAASGGPPHHAPASTPGFTAATGTPGGATGGVPGTSAGALPATGPPSAGSSAPPSPIRSGPTGSKPDAAPRGAAARRRRGGGALSGSLPIDVLLEAAAPLEQPEESVRDKIHFTFNNLTMRNLRQKLAQLMVDIEPRYIPFLARYLIIKRAAIEANFHPMYLEALDFLQQEHAPVLGRLALRETIHNVKVLLASDEITRSAPLRSLLKNLGIWLGMTTLARNKPIRHSDLAIKQLIFDAYEAGRLIAVVPFVAKVLACAKDSPVFRPPNVWTMAHLRLLVELYHVPDLKMNLKFEAAVLCNTLGVELQAVQPTSWFSKLVVRGPPFPDFNVADGTAPNVAVAPNPTAAAAGAAASDAFMRGAPQQQQQQPSPQSPHGAAGSLSSVSLGGSGGGTVSGAGASPGAAAPGAVVPGAGATGVDTDLLIARLADHVVVNPNISLFQQLPSLRRCVVLALCSAIRDIIGPVVDRSVTIACITTRKLVTLDFAMEPDETRMRRAAHLMVQSLAGSLASVMCKEPLRVAVKQHMVTMLSSNLPNVSDVMSAAEHAVQTACADNLDLACSVVERAAVDRALRDTDEALAASYQARRSHAQAGAPGGPFADGAVVRPMRAYAYTGLLPPMGSLQPAHLAVYEDFTRLSSGLLHHHGNVDIAAAAAAAAAGTIASTNATSTLGGTTAGSDGSSVATGAAAGRGATPITTTGSQAPPSPEEAEAVYRALETFRSILQDLDTILVSFASGQASGAAYNPQTEINNLIRRIPVLIARTPAPNPLVAVTFAQVIFKRLSQNDKVIFQEAHLVILKSIKDVCPVIVDDITEWTTTTGSFNKKVILGLVRLHLLNVRDYDTHLARLMETGVMRSVDLAIYLVKNCMIEGRYQTTLKPQQFPQVLSLLHRIAQHAKAPEGLAALLSDIPTGNGGDSGSANGGALSAGSASSNATSTPHSGPPSGGSASSAASSSTLDSNHAGPEFDGSAPGATGSSASSTGDDGSGHSGPTMAALRERTTHFMKEWMAALQGTNPAVGSDLAALYGVFQDLMRRQTSFASLFGNEPIIPQFLLNCGELCIDAAYTAEASTPEPATTHQYLDAFARLVLLMVMCHPVQSSPDADGSGAATSDAGGAPFKASLTRLNDMLNIIIRIMVKDYKMKKNKFNQRIYYRIFVTLINHTLDRDPLSDVADSTLQLQTVLTFSNAFYMLHPSRMPGFAFAWLELLAHRRFLPALLLPKSRRGWPAFHRLLVELLKFVEAPLRAAELTEPVRAMYRGVLRLVLVLVHDCPEFLSAYHHTLCDVIPQSCAHLRNLVLCVYPRSLGALADPFSSRDTLCHNMVKREPVVLAKYDAALARDASLKADVDALIGVPQGEGTDAAQQGCEPSASGERAKALLEGLPARLLHASADLAYAAGTRYNVPLINSLVLYVGVRGIAAADAGGDHKGGADAMLVHQPSLNVLRALVAGMDAEGRYHVLTAMANQLRYPNKHTCYFHHVLLHLFTDKLAHQGDVQEQVARVLVERVITNPPHPWGVLVTLIELVQKEAYGFNSCAFVHASSDVERLFDNVQAYIRSAATSGSVPTLSGITAGSGS